MLSALLFTLASCKEKNTEEQSKQRREMETGASHMLHQARKNLAAGNHEMARKQILEMRKTFYLAISAREAGILLMDSIELSFAQQELALADSLLRKGASEGIKEQFDEACRKVEFYRRKLKHDIKQTDKNKDEKKGN